MSTSAGAEMSAGSRSETSCETGKLSVWSAARISAGGEEVGLPRITTSSRAINAIATPAVAGTYRRTPGRGATGGGTGSDSEDHLAGALAFGHRGQRSRRFAEWEPDGHVRLDLACRVKVEQSACRGGDELGRALCVQAPVKSHHGVVLDQHVVGGGLRDAA